MLHRLLSALARKCRMCLLDECMLFVCFLSVSSCHPVVVFFSGLCKWLHKWMFETLSSVHVMSGLVLAEDLVVNSILHPSSWTPLTLICLARPDKTPFDSRSQHAIKDASAKLRYTLYDEERAACPLWRRSHFVSDPLTKARPLCVKLHTLSSVTRRWSSLCFHVTGTRSGPCCLFIFCLLSFVLTISEWRLEWRVMVSVFINIFWYKQDEPRIEDVWRSQRDLYVN